MGKIVVSESLTLDGIFEAESMGEWSNPFSSEEREGIIRETLEAAEALLMGRITYELYAPFMSNLKNNEYGTADRMNSLPKYVAATTPLEARWNNATVLPLEVVDVIKGYKERVQGDILVMGSGILAESLAKAGLVDEYKLLVHPYIMGTGRRFFKEGMGITKLKLVESKPISKGVVFLRYEA